MAKTGKLSTKASKSKPIKGGGAPKTTSARGVSGVGGKDKC